MKNSRSLNKYIANYDTLRPFLRFIDYGCYNKQYFQQQLGISARTYEDNLARLRFLLPEDMIQVHRQGHREFHTLRRNSYNNAYNCVYRIFQAKNLKPSTAFYLLSLLQIIENSPKPLTEKEIYDFHLIPDSYGIEPEQAKANIPEINMSTLKRYLRDLADLGLIHCNTSVKPHAYSARANIFQRLSPGELEELHYAIRYYMSLAPMGTLGYQLEQGLNTIYRMDMPEQEPFQFKHNNIVLPIDDAIIYTINRAIEEEQLLHFTYNGKEITALPQQLTIDFITSRQYLLALTKRSHRAVHFTHPQTYRIEQIANISIEPMDSLERYRIPLQLATEPQLLELQLVYDSDSTKHRLMYRVSTRYPNAKIIQPDEQHLSCLIQLIDPMSALPWIRTLYPHVASINHNGLQQRLQQDLKEALESYGEYPPLP